MTILCCSQQQSERIDWRGKKRQTGFSIIILFCFNTAWQAPVTAMTYILLHENIFLPPSLKTTQLMQSSALFVYRQYFSSPLQLWDMTWGRTPCFYSIDPFRETYFISSQHFPLEHMKEDCAQMNAYHHRKNHHEVIAFQLLIVIPLGEDSSHG